MMRASVLLAVASCAPGAFMPLPATTAQQMGVPEPQQPAVDNRTPPEVVASII